MLGLFRSLLICLLALALPAQGVVAATMVFCHGHPHAGFFPSAARALIETFDSPMRWSPFLILGVLIALPSCRQMRQAGAGISTGAGYVTRPVISGSKKLADATVSGSRRVADATVSGTRAMAAATVVGSQKVADATVSGAKAIAAGATRLVTFGRSKTKPAPAPLATAKPASSPDGTPLTPHVFPSSGLLVTEAELGPDATRLEATAVNLGGGWVLNGTSVAYHLDPGADDPKALLVKGRPATAVLSTEGTTTTASASELHYHASNQVLTLKGGAVLASSTTRVSATAPQTQIRIHLPTGAISITGPARWGE